ncbi:MAG TPA: SHOCT domain-containing protein [Micromonosporaceae bacterium]|jgi:hypothetical protein
MPRLLRGIARTAVIAGTATAVSNRVSRRQAGRWAQQQPAQQQSAQQQSAPVDPQPQAAAPESMSDKLDALKQLGDLKAQGVLTEAEFDEQKKRILA